MKNILSLVLLIACVYCVSSCKEKSANKAEGQESTANQDRLAEDRLSTKKTVVEKSGKIIDSDEQLKLIKNMTKIKPYEVAGMIEDAKVIINHRHKETNNKSHIILDKDLWEYQFIFSGRKMSALDQFKGCWIDFAEDNSYTYGLFDEQLGSGIYTYSIETGLLLLIDNAPNIKPQEFEATVTDNTLVMDGNDVYKDNNYNGKLGRITERPKK